MTSDTAQRVVQRPIEWPRCATPIHLDPRLESRVEEILAGMSLRRKVGQMIQAEIGSVSPEEAGEWFLGSVLNGGGSAPRGDRHAGTADWLSLADAYHARSAAAVDGGPPVPLIWGTDAVHGHNNLMGATLFPHNIGLGAAGDPALVEAIGVATAAEVAASGVEWTFAPTLAVVRDDRWGRAYEGYAEQPELVSRYAERMIHGLQGRPDGPCFLPGGRVLATAKHYIGEGGTLGGVDQGENQDPETILRDLHGPGFFAALGAGAQVVMAAFNSWQGTKIHGHHHLLTNVLKEQMGFEGFVVSDWNGFRQLTSARAEACRLSVNAGVDMLMVPNDWRELFDDLLGLAENGEIPIERIDDAVRRILRVKALIGLLDAEAPSRRPGAGDTDAPGCSGHRELARRAVRESLVLLKNGDGLLPLDGSRRILVAGDAADDIGRQCGGWSVTWQGTDTCAADFPGATSIRAGIEALVGEVGGVVDFRPDGDYETRPDAAVVVFGEQPYAEGQGDRSHLSFSLEAPEALQLLRRLRAEGIPVVSVFITGRPLWVNPELNASDAFVVAWLPGTEGAGIAEMLFRAPGGGRRHDFRGRLSFSWPRHALHSDANADTPGSDPLFPFGFGLGLDDVDRLADDLPETDLAAELDSERALPILRGRVRRGFALVLEEQSGERTTAGGRASRSANGSVAVRSVDHLIQEDARQLVWSGAQPAAVSFEWQDREAPPEVAAGAARLVCMVRVDRAPGGRVELSMAAVGGHPEALDLTAALTELEPGVWRELSFDVPAATEPTAAGAWVPWRLWTDGELELSVADLRIEPGA